MSWSKSGWGGDDSGWTYAAAAPSYAGPGDIVSGWNRWGSIAYAYSAAYAAALGAMADLVDQSNANAITINVLSNGQIDVSAIAAWVAAHSVSTIKCKQIYDQTGNGNHWSNTTLSSMPIVTLNSLNGLPTLLSASASTTSLGGTALGSAVPQPYVFASVYKKTGSAAVGNAIGFNGSGTYLGSGSSANTVHITDNGGTIGFDASASDNAFHASLGLISGASSVINVDGTETTGTTGTANLGSGSTPRIMRGNGGTLDGSWAEAGWLISTANSTLRGQIVANMQLRYGL